MVKSYKLPFTVIVANAVLVTKSRPFTDYSKYLNGDSFDYINVNVNIKDTKLLFLQ